MRDWCVVKHNVYIKLENAGQPHDEMIESVSSYIKGLRYGSDELKLVRLDDTAFQVKMNELNRYFEELCKEILLIREKGYENTNIIEMSETFFNICDEATGLPNKNKCEEILNKPKSLTTEDAVAVC